MKPSFCIVQIIETGLGTVWQGIGARNGVLSHEVLARQTRPDGYEQLYEGVR